MIGKLFNDHYIGPGGAYSTCRNVEQLLIVLHSRLLLFLHKTKQVSFKKGIEDTLYYGRVNKE